MHQTPYKMTDQTDPDVSKVNLETLEKLKSFGGDAVIVEMIKLFLTYTPSRLNECRQGLETGDCYMIELACHSLRSTSAQIGMEGIQAVSTRIEALAVEKKIEAIPPLVKDLERGFETIKTILENKLADIEKRNHPS